MMDDFLNTTAVEVAAAVRAGQTSAREQTQRALDAIDSKNPEINAFVAIDAERALAEADAVDAAIARGDAPGPLAGVPIGVKDLENAAGYTTTFGSRLHADDPPAETDSVLVSRLRAAGCVVVGKTNTPEFGAVGDTFNEVFGETRNPHNTERSAGGSSGGAGAALAAGMVPLATGSDGGGSIRIPSAVNGLSGLKPSVGRVPMSGPEPTAWLHYSTPGPMARRITDVAYALDVAVGPDQTDRLSLPHHRGEAWYDSTVSAAAPRAVLWSKNMGYGTNDQEVESVLTSAVGQIAAAGVEVIEVDVFDHNPMRDWAMLAFTGLAAKVRPYRDTPQWELLGDPVREAVQIVDQVDRFGVYDSIVVGHRLNYRLAELFHRAPILLAPVTAGQVGRPREQGTVNGEQTIDWITYTPPFNMTGNPAGTLQAGTTADGMPVGLQVVGPQHADVAVLRAIHAFEQIFDQS